MKNDDPKIERAFQERIGDLYPDLTPEERAEAEYYLIKYFEAVNAIFEEKYGLTGSDLNATV